jgi:hypothetical protein
MVLMDARPQDTPGALAVRLVRTALPNLNQGGVTSLRMAATKVLADLPRAQRLSLVVHLTWIVAVFAARIPAEEREVILAQFAAANTVKPLLDHLEGGER